MWRQPKAVWAVALTSLVCHSYACVVTNIAMYLRQSQDRDDDKLAITRQREDCLRLCKAKASTRRRVVGSSPLSLNPIVSQSLP